MALVPLRCLFVLPLALLAGCGGDPPAPSAEPAPALVAVVPAGIDWSRCKFPGLTLPLPGTVIAVDGGLSVPDAEPGRESIRRVEIVVPGQVALLLTAPDATVWLLRPSPETELVGIFASAWAPTCWPDPGPWVTTAEGIGWRPMPAPPWKRPVRGCSAVNSRPCTVCTAAWR